MRSLLDLYTKFCVLGRNGGMLRGQAERSAELAADTLAAAGFWGEGVEVETVRHRNNKAASAWHIVVSWCPSDPPAYATARLRGRLYFADYAAFLQWLTALRLTVDASAVRR